MSQQLVDLSKKAQQVLDLRKISSVKAQVMMGMDGSGSMEMGRTMLYSDGTVQKAVDRIAAIALLFDDNGELDSAVFSSGVNPAKPVTAANHTTYVQKELLDKRLVPFGGTRFVPLINHAISEYFDDSIVASVAEGAKSVMGALKDVFGFGKKTAAPAATSASNGKSKSGLPVFAIIISDGDNSDEDETTALLTQMQDKNIYWQFVGIGTATNFRYLNKVADELPNVGFFQIPDLAAIKDMELYKQLLNEEFSNWVRKF